MIGLRNIVKFATCYLLISISHAHAQDGCTGPRNVAELADTLWDEQSQYNGMRYTRPNVSKLDGSDSTANPAHADADNVQFEMHVLSVKDVNQQKGEVQFNVGLVQQWNDFRLMFKTERDGGCFLDNERIGFDEDVVNSIWTPHVVVSNLVDEKIKMASSLWIYPNGDIVYTEYWLLKTSCQLDLRAFPGDTQTCSIVVGSWRDAFHQVILGLIDSAITKSGEGGDYGAADSVEWDIVGVSATVDTRDLSQFATFSLTLERDRSYYNQFVIFPVLIIVIISWSSFFIDRSAAC